MKKYMFLLLGAVIGLMCNPGTETPPSVKSVEITPPGDTTATTLTANIQVEGSGKIDVKWFNAVFDTIRIVQTDTIEIDTNGTYASTLASGLGWYWIDIVNENDSLLWHTDSVFCGSQPTAEFYPDWEYGPHPLRVTFYNYSRKDDYTQAFWDFRDGATATEWEPTHLFENPGQFYVVLKITNLAGSASDSTLIYVW